MRGVGSVYYLAYAVAHGVAGELAERLIGLVVAVVAASVAAHGISVTPLMNVYARVSGSRGRESSHARSPGGTP